MKDRKTNTYDMEGSRAKSLLLKEDPIIIEMAAGMKRAIDAEPDSPMPHRNTLILSASLTYKDQGGTINHSRHIGAPMEAVNMILKRWNNPPPHDCISEDSAEWKRCLWCGKTTGVRLVENSDE